MLFLYLFTHFFHKGGRTLKLIAVTNDTLDNTSLAKRLMAIEPFIDYVIVREKSKRIRDWFELFDILDRLSFPKEKVIVHDRLDVAHIRSFRTVQLPGHSVPLQEAVESYPQLMIGRSVHSYEEARQAERDGAHYLLYGHIYSTPSKKGVPPRGTSELRKIVRDVSIPVYAIGGIRLQHLDEMKAVGVDGVAVLSPFFTTDEPQRLAQQFRAIIERSES